MHLYILSQKGVVYDLNSDRWIHFLRKLLLCYGSSSYTSNVASLLFLYIFMYVCGCVLVYIYIYIIHIVSNILLNIIDIFLSAYLFVNPLE